MKVQLCPRCFLKCLSLWLCLSMGIHIWLMVFVLNLTLGFLLSAHVQQLYKIFQCCFETVFWFSWWMINLTNFSKSAIETLENLCLLVKIILAESRFLSGSWRWPISNKIQENMDKICELNDEVHCWTIH